MGCLSGNNWCDIVDLVVCTIRCVLDKFCNLNVLLTFCILPSLVTDFIVDGIGVIRMMFLSCVYYDSTEYYEGGEDYAFSFDPTAIINRCDLNDTELNMLNKTEVSHHKTFVFLVSPWLLGIIFYMLGCAVYYFFCIYKMCKDGECCDTSFELTVPQYILAFSAIKILNIYATGLIFVKGIFVFVYVTPDAFEITICIISIIDFFWSIGELITIFLLVKKDSIEEIKDSTTWCCCVRCISKPINNEHNESPTHSNQIVSQADPYTISTGNSNQISQQIYGTGGYYFQHVTARTNRNTMSSIQTQSILTVQEASYS